MKHSLTITIVAALSMCGMAQAATRATMALTADIRSTNPGVDRDDNTDGVILNIVEGLVGYGEGGDVKPLLARSIVVSDNGLTYTFKLRSGVRFHNGEELTSADVTWTWDRYLNPKTGWRCLADFDGRNGPKLLSVEAPDQETVVMHIDHPAALFLDTMARTDCGMTAILNKASIKPDGSWDRPIGTGPYRLVEWKHGRSITLARFDAYQSPPGTGFDGYVGLKAPRVDEIEFQVVPDPATIKMAMSSRSLDIAQALSSDVKELEADTNLVVFPIPDSSKNVLLFQTKDPLLGDRKLRQAIAAALDYVQLVEAASDGLSHPNNSSVFQGSVYFDAVQREGFRTDITAAQKLLRDSSYKGQTIKMIANKRSPMPSFQVAVVTQAMLQAVGVNVEIEVLDWATQLDRYNSGNYQMMSFSYSARLDPALSYEQFAGDKTKQPRKVWDDPQALALIERAKQVSDPSDRGKIFDALHQMALNDAPLLMLYNGLTVWVCNKRVSDFKPWEGKPRLWNMRVDG
jgi:peptide/nickel transport system substrate-binding protein